MENISTYISKNKKKQDGVTLVLVAILLLLFIGFAALAIDVSHLYAVRNQLQNAADAGALAGARILFNNDYSINEDALDVAEEAAEKNKAMAEGGTKSVEVIHSETASEVEFGHWSFGSTTDLKKGFYPADSVPESPYNIIGIDEDVLDADKDYINAIRLVARRKASPAVSFFARIFGHESFELSATAVGYRGFAGNLVPGEADLPIVIPKSKLGDLSLGFMTTSGDTLWWTDFSQPAANVSQQSITDIIQDEDNPGQNPNPLILGETIGINNGQIDNAFSGNYTDLMDLWADGEVNGSPINVLETASYNGEWPEIPWYVTIPVGDDTGGVSPGQGVPFVGVANVEILWIADKAQTNKMDAEVPFRMGEWVATENDTYTQVTSANKIPAGQLSDGIKRWNNFVDYFDICLPDDDPTDNNPPPLATYENGGYMTRTIYFGKVGPAVPVGGTGGENYGVYSREPVLVD